jgi:hypothetical protein
MPPVDSGKNKAAIDFWENGKNLNYKEYPIKVIEA